jgi:hypothetical protein
MKTAAERKREQRRRALTEGKCEVCCVTPARNGMTTCEPCSSAAYERVKARRGYGRTVQADTGPVRGHQSAW